MKRAAIITVILAIIFLTVPTAFAADTTLRGIQVFPADYVWNVPVDKLPVLPNSAQMIATQNGMNGRVHAAFAYTLNVVDSSTARYVRATTYYSSPDVLYSIPKSGIKIGNGRSDGTCDTSRYDCHAIVVDLDKKMSYEFFGLSGTFYPDGSIKTKSAAAWPLNDYSLNTHGTVVAVDTSHLVGQVRYEEIEKGVIPHAIQIAIPYTRYGYGNYVWPADRSNSIYVKNTSANYPRMGERIRLKASFDASGYSRTNQIIIQAMKTYGMIVVDNGEKRIDRTFDLRGFDDSRWSYSDLSQLQNIKGSDLEVVDESSLMITKTSGQARITSNTLTDKTQIISKTSPTTTITSTPTPAPFFFFFFFFFQ